MSLGSDAITVMQSGYVQSSRDGRQVRPGEFEASDGRHLLNAVFWVSREWKDRLALDDPRRVNLISLGLLADDLIRAGNYSSDAMTTARAVLCVNCRRLDAAQGQCTGLPLDRCQLLKNALR